jgi:hypothetical protein
VLGFRPATLGLLIGSGGLGALVGAALSQSFARRLGLGRALIAAQAVMGVLGLLIPVAGGRRWLAFGFMLLPQLGGDLFRTIFEIGALSLRQTMTPLHLLVRVGASMNFLVGGCATLDLLAGGALGSAIGLRPAIWVAALAGAATLLLLAFSPVGALWKRVRESR